MEKSSPRRFRWIRLVSSMFGILLLLPATRYLLRMQFQMETLTYATQLDHAAERAVAERLPDDYRVQLALVMESPSTSVDAALSQSKYWESSNIRHSHIHALMQRFPNNPSVYANLLCLMTSDVYISLDSNSYFPHTIVRSSHHQPSPESLALFMTLAQKGAQLDPNNAYFPMMQANALLAVYQDQEAVYALKRAGRCTHWTEYFQDEVEGRNRLQSAVYGDRGAIQRLDNVNDLMLPQCYQLRQASLVASSLAEQAERSGNAQEGIAIRHALMRCGGLMRSQGTLYQTAFAGISIVKYGIVNPGGYPNPNGDLGDYKQRLQRSRDRYCSFLKNLGQMQEAVWAKQEFMADDQAQAVAESSRGEYDAELRQDNKLSFSWMANIILLTGSLILAIVGAAANLAVRIRPRRALIAWQIAYALLLIGGIGLWQWKSAWIVIAPFVGFPSDLFAIPSHVTDHMAYCSGTHDLLFGCCVLAATSWCGLLATLSLFQNVPLATGLGRGLRGTALPMATAMFLLYGISLAPTVCLEAEINTRIARRVDNELHYMAEITHKVWPGDPQP